MTEVQIYSLVGCLVPIALDIFFGFLPSSIMKYKGLLLSIANKMYNNGLDEDL